MDALLRESLSAGTKPFDGNLIHTADLLPLSHLSQVLAKTIQVLRSKWPDAELRRHADWHEHDGYLTSSATSCWSEVEDLVSSPEHLYANRPGEDFVRIGIYDLQGSFYLRVWVPDENDDPELHPGRWGSFDIAGPDELLRAVQAFATGLALRTTSAVAYFTACSAE